MTGRPSATTDPMPPAMRDEQARTVELRPLLAGAAVLALALAMLPAWGFYRRETFLAAVVALLAAFAACVLPERWLRLPDWSLRAGLILAAGAVTAVCAWHWWQFGPEIGTALVLLAAAVMAVGLAIGLLHPARMTQPLLPGLALFLAGLGVVSDGLFYPEVPAALLIIHVATVVGFLLLISLVINWSARPSRFYWTRIVLLFACGATLRGGAVVASPDPVIDVYVWLRDAPDALLHGRNPYAIEYPNIYAGERARQYGMAEPGPKAWRLPAYPPVPIVLALPFRAIGLDVRYANVLCDLLAAGVILAAGRGKMDWQVGAVAAGAYLLFPGTPFMIEQAWYEPMVAALLGGGLLLAERRWRVGYLLTGLGLTAKQYGVAMLLPLLRAAGRHWRLLVAGLVAAGLLFIPFFLWGPRDFLDVILRLHMQRPVQKDSITLHSGADDLLGVPLPRELLWALALVLVGWIAWRTPRTGVACALWTGTALLAFCLCHTQGYFNYFFLCEFLWLLGIVGLGQNSANPSPEPEYKM